MDFSKLFKTRREQPKSSEAPNHWVKCESCGSLMYRKEVMLQANVCPKCGFHMRINAEHRINLLSDKGTFVKFDENLTAIDPLKFVDKKSYKKRIEEAKGKTGRNSAVIAGECKIEGVSVQLVVFDFEFMGGSLASVEGEMIVRAVQRAIYKNHGVVIVSASGGARMQESTFSLMQMAKTSAILTKLSEKKLPFISVLTDPTMGGVSASFAWLGDVIIAEPGALIGFAGQRVIKQTIGTELPEGFQRAEFLLQHGLIDMIVKRCNLKRTIADLLIYFSNSKPEFLELQYKNEDVIKTDIRETE